MFDKAVNELSMTGVKGFELLMRILEFFPPLLTSDLIMGEANLWLSSYWTGIIL